MYRVVPCCIYCSVTMTVTGCLTGRHAVPYSLQQRSRMILFGSSAWRTRDEPLIVKVQYSITHRFKSQLTLKTASQIIKNVS